MEDLSDNINIPIEAQSYLDKYLFADRILLPENVLDIVYEWEHEAYKVVDHPEIVLVGSNGNNGRLLRTEKTQSIQDLDLFMVIKSDSPKQMDAIRDLNKVMFQKLINAEVNVCSLINPMHFCINVKDTSHATNILQSVYNHGASVHNLMSIGAPLLTRDSYLALRWAQTLQSTGVYGAFQLHSLLYKSMQFVMQPKVSYLKDTAFVRLSPDQRSSILEQARRKSLEFVQNRLSALFTLGYSIVE